MRRFTRAELHKLVWESPVSSVAKDLALSDVAIHKICRKHDIPTPPRGWWAAKAAGKSVQRTPLTKAKKGFGEEIIIAAGTSVPEPPLVAAAREAARVAASAAEYTTIANVGPIVQRTIERLRKQVPTEHGLVSVSGSNVIKCAVGTASIDRLSEILVALERAAALQGFHLTPGDQCAHFEGRGETVSFNIIEKLQRLAHVPTSIEAAKIAAWERERPVYRGKDAWRNDRTFGRPRLPEWDHVPTGSLNIEFEPFYRWSGYVSRRSFRDGRVQRLEDITSDIAVGLAIFATAKSEAERERKAKLASIDAAHRQSLASARRERIEDRRASALVKMVRDLEDIDRMKRMVAMVEAREDHHDFPRVGTFLEWVRGYISRREAVLLPANLEDHFVCEKVFDEDDESKVPMTPFQTL